MTSAGEKLDLTGWIPIDFSWPDEPLDSHLDRIEWLSCPGASFSEPFFLQSVARLERLNESTEIVCTNFSAIANRTDISFDYQPAGIIFHISRCGSTAVANCLKHCEKTQVVSEYWPLTQYHWRRILTREKPISRRVMELDALALKFAAWSLARCRLGENENLVFKLTSTSLHSLEAIKAIWPNVPRLLILRSPIEVAVSSLQGGGWESFRDHPLRSKALIGVAVGGAEGAKTMSTEEYVARVLAGFLDIVAANLADFDMVIRHDQLTGTTLQEIAALFNLSPISIEQVDRELKKDGKRRGPYLVPSACSRNAVRSYEMEAQISAHVALKYEAITARL